MRPGELRRRLLMERAAFTMDAAGGHERAWTVEGEVFGAVRPRRRRETVSAGRAMGLVTHVITVRWRDDIDSHVRFSDGSVRYRVLATEAADPQRRYLDCLCEEEQG